MKKSNVLIIVHSAFSHIITPLNLYFELKSKGFNPVIISGIPGKLHLDKLNLTYELLNSMPFGMGFEEVLAKNSIVWKKFLYLTNTLFKRRNKEFEYLSNKYKPEIVFIDLIYASDAYFFLKSSSVRQVFYFSTMPTLSRTNIAPPIHSKLVHPDCKNIKEEWEDFNILKLLGKTDYLSSNDIKLLNLVNIIPNHPICLNDVVHMKYANIQELHFLTNEFEFTGNVPNINQIYLGMQSYKRNEVALFGEKTFTKVYSTLMKAKRNYEKIIYFGVGSMYFLYDESVKIFINRILEILTRRVSIFTIISIPDSYISANINLGDNIKVFNVVPQQLVLKEVNLFISHAGLNSIKEAIDSKTPMLVSPINKKWDNNGNCARVVHHKLGESISPTDEVSLIEKKIDRLLYDNSEYIKNLELHAKNDSRYNLKKIISDLF